MRREKYESPKFDFQDVKLLERVADVCWGKSHKAWFDANKNGSLDPGEKLYTVQGSSCDDAGRKLLEAMIRDGYKLGVDFVEKDVHENVNSQLITEIYS